ncbi:hypothetical protein D3C71_328890 [compost metagenome]
MSTSNNNPHDISAQVAELRAEMRAENANTRRILDKVATSVEKLSAIEAQNTGRDAKLGDHEARIRGLETAWLKVTGAMVLLSSLGPLVAKKLGFF